MQSNAVRTTSGKIEGQRAHPPVHRVPGKPDQSQRNERLDLAFGRHGRRHHQCRRARTSCPAVKAEAGALDHSHFGCGAYRRDCYRSLLSDLNRRTCGMACGAPSSLHDAANSIATVVSTNVLSPKVAVLWAAFFNFIAFLVFGLQVAQTMGTGIVSDDAINGSGPCSAPSPGTPSPGGPGYRRAARMRWSAGWSAPAWRPPEAGPSYGAE